MPPKHRSYYRLAWLTVAAVLMIALTVGFLWAINRRAQSGPSAAAYTEQIERLRSDLAEERRERERLSKVVVQQQRPQPRLTARQTPKSGSPAKAPPPAPKTVAEVEDAIIRDAREIQAGLDPAKRKRAWELLPEVDQVGIRHINSEISARPLRHDESAIVSLHLDHFNDRPLAVRRLLEFAEAEGWPAAVARIGVADPHSVVRSKLSFSALSPNDQEMARITARVIAQNGLGGLDDDMKAFVRLHRGLFPAP